jgi:hypothetical protein
LLVVEDDDALATLIQYNLEKEGYRRHPSPATARRRWFLADERLPDLIVLDWMLPKVSGIEVCRRLRGRPEKPQCADHHAHRARRGERPGAGPRYRRRRLCGQAVLGARADCPHPRCDAPHPPGSWPMTA